MPGIAIESHVIGLQPATAPAGFATLRTVFERVPHEVTLADGWSAIVYTPTGMARAWLDGDPADVVSTSEEEYRSRGPGNGGAIFCPVRLVIRRDGAVRGGFALAVGVTGTFRARSAMLEVVPLSWEIRAGAMRGGSPGGGRIELAWRSRVVPSGVLTEAGAPGASPR